MTKTLTKLSDEAIIREAWFRGNLRYLTKPGPQRDAYDFVRNRDKSWAAFSPFVFNFHRRLGKTFLSILLCIEECLRRKGVFAKFAAPSSIQAYDVLEEHWAIIMQDCPPELEPKPWKNEKFTFRNPRWANSPHDFSILRLYGVKNDRGNKMRGGSTDLAILDECREMEDLQYTWGSVLLPTFRGRPEPLALMISTPPESMDHPWVSRYIKQAQERGLYRVMPGSEDPTWTEEEDDAMAREMGGRDTPEYQREIECKLISDGSNLIIPEFGRGDIVDEKQRLIANAFVGEHERPKHYIAYTIGDMGGAGKMTTDRTGILFAFLDFTDETLVIEDELFLRDYDTESLALMWRDKCRQVYDQSSEREQGRELLRVYWYADCTEQQRIDFARLYQVTTSPIITQDKEAARKLLRTAFNVGRIKIHPRCVELMYQLRNGTRLPRGDFTRSDRLGHCDLVSALIHLYRVVNFDENPIPTPTYDRSEYFVPPKQPSTTGWGRFYRGPKKW